MPRAYWKGYLRLSLVTCPIELFPATSQSEKTHFHQINTQTGHRLRQQMIDEETGRAVDAAHKGRGYELSKGKYVEIDEDELKAIQIESTHTVDIEGFVPRAEIDMRYLDKPYYIAPNGKTGAEAFVVIRDAMQDEERIALARIVIAHREHIIMLEPLGKGLLGTPCATIMKCETRKSTSRTSRRLASARTWFLWHPIFLKARRRDSILKNSRMNMRRRCASSCSARPRGMPSRRQSLRKNPAMSPT
jgi:non-homologous end joining protein Ku